MEVEAGASDAQQLQLKGQEEAEQGEKLFHVLAVDDSLIDRKLLERLLRVSSYQVTCVDSGDKALQYLGLLDNLDNASSSSSSCSLQSPQQEDIKVNLIMTDYCMPGISGYDLLKRVKESSWKDVPVVIMSSENIPSRISMCLEGGAEEFLLKPLQLSDVEKLQLHLIKSQKYSCERNGDSLSDGNSHGNKNDSNIIKRKAILTEPSDKRPKLEGLAVI